MRVGRCLGVAVLGGLLMGLGAVPVSADTIRLKNGRVIEGSVVREDETQVTIMVGSRPEFYAREEVESIRRGWHLSVSTTPQAFQVLPAERDVAIDDAPLKNLGRRLRDLDGFLAHLGRAREALARRDADEAVEHARQGARLFLPTAGTRWSPLSVLVDVIILVLLRAPILWLATLLLKGQPQFLRCVLLVLLAYGLLLASAVLMASVRLQPVGLVLLLGAIVWIVGWAALVPLGMRMLNLGPRQTILALVLTLVANLALDRVVLQTQWL